MKKWLLLFCLSATVSNAVDAQGTPKDTTLKAYVGKYVFPQGSVVTEVNVILGDDGVLTSSSSAGVSELVKKEKDIFEIPKYNGGAKFHRDSATGKVIGVSIQAMGYQLEGTKTTDSNPTTFMHTKKLVARDPPAAFSIR